MGRTAQYTVLVVRRSLQSCNGGKVLQVDGARSCAVTAGQTGEPTAAADWRRGTCRASCHSKPRGAGGCTSMNSSASSPAAWLVGPGADWPPALRAAVCPAPQNSAGIRRAHAASRGTSCDLACTRSDRKVLAVHSEATRNSLETRQLYGDGANRARGRPGQPWACGTGLGCTCDTETDESSRPARVCPCPLSLALGGARSFSVVMIPCAAIAQISVRSPSLEGGSRVSRRRL